MISVGIGIDAVMTYYPRQRRTRRVDFYVIESYICNGVRSKYPEECAAGYNFLIDYIDFYVFKRSIEQSSRDKRSVCTDCINFFKLYVFNRSALDRTEQSAAPHISADKAVSSSVQSSRKTSARVRPLYFRRAVRTSNVYVVRKYEIFAFVVFIFALCRRSSFFLVSYAIYKFVVIRNALRYERNGNHNRMIEIVIIGNDNGKRLFSVYRIAHSFGNREIFDIVS